LLMNHAGECKRMCPTRDGGPAPSTGSGALAA
jgi:hypothetical protein